jgi:elongation factor Ts
MSFTANDVKTLRERTGAGMMDCKKALVETDGDMEKAVDYLREKGIAKAAKKAGRIAAEGIVDSYIHMGGKVGVLLEVNCETDFVARGEQFKALVHDIALQIAAANPSYVSVEEVPAEVIEKEKEILLAQMQNDEKNANKPKEILEKIVTGKIGKFYTENCLMNQLFVKDDSMTMEQVIGNKFTVTKFVRWVMGEGLEKRNDDFAAEVAATAAAAAAKH